MGTKLIFGFGYVGSRVGACWLASGDQVHAVTRSEGRAAELRSLGYQGHVANVTDPASLANLPPADTVLYAVGFDRSAGLGMRQVYVEGLRSTLAALPESVTRLIYISSTGVYGDQDGDWVDESTPCHPDREGGQATLEAEQVLQTHPLGSCAVVLRLAGIYGPQRVPRSEMLKSGEPIGVDPDSFLNLVHVDDVVEVVNLVGQQASTPNLYLVSDGHPVRRGDYYRCAAKLLGAPEPTFAASQNPAAGDRKSGTSKRISNRKLQQEFAVPWHFPDYAAGLKAILNTET